MILLIKVVPTFKEINQTMLFCKRKLALSHSVFVFSITVVEVSVEIIRICLVSLFNGISTFVVYSTPKSSF